MATLAAGLLTLLDWAKRTDPDGSTPIIAEMLSQNNEVLTDMVWLEGNLATGHRTTVRTGLPAVAWRLLNQGVAPSKSTTAQIDEACGMLEAWSEVDKRLADLSGNLNGFLMSESAAFIEAMNQEFVQTLFYGNSGTAPEEFTGLSTRYSSTTAGNGANIISAGGTGSDNSSIWLLVWGENTMHGIYPKGSKAGLRHTNHGSGIVETTAAIAGSRMVAYRNQFEWDCGIALRDWRFGVRIPNIDISNLSTKTGAADLMELMIRAYHRIPSFSMGRAAWYMNRTCHQMLDIQKRDDVQLGGQLGYSQADGVPVLTFRGIPIRKCDQLLETEAAVS